MLLNETLYQKYTVRYNAQWIQYYSEYLIKNKEKDP